MSVGVLIMPDRDAANVVDDILEKARGAHHGGVRQLWLGQQSGLADQRCVWEVAAAFPPHR
jgi:hypothetical protein